MTVDEAGRRRRERSPRGGGEALRGDVLEAVARLLDRQEDNPDLGLSLREVARETGIAAQSLYLHFDRRESLAGAAAEDGYARLVAAMRDADAGAAGRGAPAAERLRAQAHCFREFAVGHRGLFRLMFGRDVSRLDPALSGHPAGALWEQWFGAVRACEAEGLHWPAGAEQTALYLWSALLGHFALVSMTFPGHNRVPPGDFIDRTVDTLLAAATRRA